MKAKFLTLFSLIFLVIFSSCGNNEGVKEELPTQTQIEEEKQAIREVIKTFNEASQEKNWSKMITTLDEEVAFFGTDSGEVAKNFETFKQDMQSQWEHYELFEYGQIQDVFIQFDDYARYANVIFGVPLTYAEKDKPTENLFIVAQRTLKKDPIRQKWVIQSGIVSVPRPVNRG